MPAILPQWHPYLLWQDYTLNFHPYYYTHHCRTGSRADLTGYSLDKALKRKTVETLSLKISNAVASLAAINGDLILKKRAEFSTSSWYKITEDELVTQATIVRDLGQANATAMASYGAETAEGPEPVLLSGGETRSRLAENLAPAGTYLIVKNPGTLAVTVRLWVE